jgi:hypothetical protein
MGEKIYLRLTGTIFGVVCCLHILRLLSGWPVMIGTWEAPLWFSWGGLPASGALSIWAFCLAARKS